MPNPVPDTLTETAAALYASIGSLIGSGVGADRAYKLLRESGNYIPRAQVRTIASEIRTSLGYRQDLAKLNPDEQVPYRLVAPNSALKTDDFVHTVSLLIRDKTTGFVAQQFYTYVSPDLQSFSDLMGAAEGEEGTIPQWYEYDIIAASFVGVSQRA